LKLDITALSTENTMKNAFKGEDRKLNAFKEKYI
jgi:hypothetical protein